MKIQKEIKTYCKKCNKHETHKLKVFKVKKPRTLSIGTRKNVDKHKSGYGGKAKFNATVKKQSKKPTFVAECDVCKAKHYYVIPKKMKKAEIVA